MTEIQVIIVFSIALLIIIGTILYFNYKRSEFLSEHFRGLDKEEKELFILNKLFF